MDTGTQIKEKKRKRRGQIILRDENVFLIRVPLSRDPVTGQRSYHNETFHGTHTKAEKRCLQLIASIDSGEFFQPSNLTVGELCDKWLAHVKRQGVRANTHDVYRAKLRNYVRPAIGHLLLSRLTPMTLQNMFNDLIDRKLASLTVRNVRSILSSVLRFAVKQRFLKEYLIDNVETPAGVRLPVRAMDEAEALRFVEAARVAPDGFLFLLWLYVGLRPAEYLALRWSDIEETEGFGVIHVRHSLMRSSGGGWQLTEPKTPKALRRVYFPAWLYRDLQKHRDEQLARILAFGRQYYDHDFIFTARNGEPLQRANLALRKFKPLLKAAELDEGFTLYTLRRSFSSLLRRGGVSAKEVAEQMGHKREDFTDDVYVTVFDSAKREMVGTLERMLFDESGTQAVH